MEGVKELIDILNKALPGAWEATVRQVYIHGGLFTFFGVLSGIIALVLFFKFGTDDKDKESEDSEVDDGTQVIHFLAICVLAIAFIVLTITGIIYLANPEYQAIRLLKAS